MGLWRFGAVGVRGPREVPEEKPRLTFQERLAALKGSGSAVLSCSLLKTQSIRGGIVHTWKLTPTERPEQSGEVLLFTEGKRL